MIKSVIQGVFNSMGLEVRKKFAHTYYEDGLRTIHDSSFAIDSRFLNAYQTAKSLTGGQEVYQGPWRAHIAMWAAQTALARPSGDFVECGVWRGFVSCAAMTFVNWNANHKTRRFFLVDSFEGLSTELRTQQEWEVGTYLTFGDQYKGTLEFAKNALKRFDDVHFIKGWVPEVLGSIPTNVVAYLHLDMNAAIPEREALKYFWPKMVTGGIILFDDYAYHGYRPQKLALDEIAEQFGVSIASLPTGQGLLVK
jgi:hypothetical protein